MAGPVPIGTARIFISYRREDASYPAAWLYDHLADRFGAGHVFKDIDSIQLGDDFVEIIHRAVGSCDVLLALVGDQWLTLTDRHGRRRLDDPDDFVRLEIEAALSRDVRVIPILVGGARLPEAEELPDDISGLVRRQALELSPERFGYDTNRLLKVLETVLDEVRRTRDDASQAPAAADDAAPEGAPAGASGRSRRTTPTRKWVWGGLGVVAVLIVATTLVLTGVPSSGPAGLLVDSTSVTSADGLRLSGLKAVSDPDPPAVGGVITVSFTLTNVGDGPVELLQTFVGVRSATRAHRDSIGTNQGTTLAPGEAVDAQGRVPTDSAGTWKLWPCYELATGAICPNDWQAFPVAVH